MVARPKKSDAQLLAEAVQERNKADQVHTRLTEMNEAPLFETRGGGELWLPRRGKVAEVRLVFDPAEAFPLLRQEPELFVDIETSGLSPWQDRIALVQIYGPNAGIILLHHNRGGKLHQAVIDLLSNPDITITGHNLVGFDALFLHNAGVDILKPKLRDTLIQELCAVKTDRRDVRVSLEATVKRRTGVQLDKSIDHRTWMQPTLTPAQLAYATGDVRFLPMLSQEQQEAVKGSGQERAMQFELSLMPTIIRMVLNGLPFNTVAYGQYIDDLTAKRDEALGRLHEAFGPINLRSSQQVKAALAKYGVVLNSTAHDKLVEVSEMGGHAGAVVDLLLDHRMFDQRVKMYSAEWLDKYVTDGWVHPRIWQCAADTSRMTNSEPNLQQVPKDDPSKTAMRVVRALADQVDHGWYLMSARKLFAAPPGYKIVSADYSQIEVRVAAYWARDTALIAALEAEDLHRAVASGIFGKPPEQITPDERKLAKASTFTLLFGGGSTRLYDYARHNGSSIDEVTARRVVEKFFSRFKGLATMRWKAFARANSGMAVPIDLPNGWRRVLVGANLTGTRILNTLVQGTAAVGLKHGLLVCQERGLDKYLGATVHDENVACVPENEAEEYAKELEEAMVVGMQRVIPGIPVKVEVTTADTWGGHRYGLSEDGKHDHLHESRSYALSKEERIRP